MMNKSNINSETRPRHHVDVIENVRIGDLLVKEGFVSQHDLQRALTMLDDGLQKLQQTTLSEIIRVVSYDMIQTFRLREKQKLAREKHLPEGARQFMVSGMRGQDSK